MNRDDRETCPLCGSTVSERGIALYRGLVLSLGRVYLYVQRRGGGYRFSRKEVKGLFRNENDTARFGDLVMFGGLVFKEGKAKYGLNMERCEQFFNNQYRIPTKIWKNPVTGELRKEDYRTLSEIPGLHEMLDEDGFYQPQYRQGELL